MSQKSTFTPWYGEMICAGLAEGQPLTAVCDALGVLEATARKWEVDNPEHGSNSTYAREIGCHAMAAQCLQIADNDTRDWEPVLDADGRVIGVKVDGEHVSRSKLRIETRMRLIGKWLPKIYGDKLALGGADDLPPIKTMPDAQLLSRIEALQAKMNAAKG